MGGTTQGILDNANKAEDDLANQFAKTGVSDANNVGAGPSNKN